MDREYKIIKKGNNYYGKFSRNFLGYQYWRKIRGYHLDRQKIKYVNWFKLSLYPTILFFIFTFTGVPDIFAKPIVVFYTVFFILQFISALIIFIDMDVDMHKQHVLKSIYKENIENDINEFEIIRKNIEKEKTSKEQTVSYYMKNGKILDGKQLNRKTMFEKIIK